MVLWLVLILILFKSEFLVGTSDVFFIGMLNGDQRLEKITRINNLQVIQNSGVQLLRNGGFNIATGGIYFVSVSAVIDVISEERIILAVNVNNEKLKESSMQAVYSDGIGMATIQVHGLIKCSYHDHIVLYLLSNSTQNVLMQSTRISLLLISRALHNQAFSLRLLQDVAIKKEVSQLTWTSSNALGSFINTNLFTISEGYFVTELNGLYHICGNFMLRNRYKEKCTHHINLYINTLKQSVVVATKTTSSEHRIFMMNFAMTFKLQKGKKIWLQVLSSCFYTDLLKHSTYSLTYLRSTKGYSLQSEKFSSYLHTQGWTSLRLGDFSVNVPGGFISSGHKIQSDNLLITTDGMILVTGTFYLKTPLNATSLKVMITRNTMPLIGHKDASYVESTSSGLSIYHAMISISSMISVKSNDHLRFSIYFPTSETWILFKNSSISLVYVNTERKLLETKEHEIAGTSRTWNVLETCSLNSDGSASYKNGLIKAITSGIHYVSVYVTVLGYGQNKLTVALIYNDEDEEGLKRKVALSATETSINKIFTLKLSSSIRIDTDQHFGIYLQLPVGVKFKTKCGISLTYLGYISNVLGFQGNLHQDIVQNSPGYLGAHNYYDPSRVKLAQKFYYNTGNDFNFKTGTYTASMAGIYLVSLNVIIRNVNAMASDSFFTVLVYLNNLPSTVLLSKRQEKLNHEETDRNAIISFTVSAPLKLQTSDKLVLKIFSRSDNYWTLDKRTSFSVALISLLKFANGFVAHRADDFKLVMEEKWSQILGWSTSNPADGRFDGRSAQSPELVDKEKITIHTTGVYLISFQLHLKQEKIQKVFQIGLFQKNGEKSFELIETCDEVANPFKIMSVSCFIILKSEKNEEYIFKLYSPIGINAADLYNFHQEKLHVAFLSAFLLNTPSEYPAGTYMVKDGSGLIGNDEKLSPWYKNQLVSSIGSNSFSANSGILTAQATGWYLVSLQIFYKKPFGNITTMVKSQKTEMTDVLQSSATVRNRIAADICLTGVQYLSTGNTLYPAIEAFGPGEIISHASSFSYAFLPSLFESLNQIFIKINPFKVSSATNKKVTEWKQVGRSLLISDDVIIAKVGVYIVSTNFIITSDTSTINLEIEISGKDRLFMCKYAAKQNEVFTLLLAGVVVLKSADVVSFYIRATGKTTVLPKSSTSLAYLGDDISTHPILILKVTKSKKHGERINKWVVITSFTEWSRQHFYHRNSVVVNQLAGVYFVSTNLIISVSKRSSLLSSAIYSFGVFINDELVISTSRDVSSTFTASIAQTIYLRRGSVIALKVMSNSENRFAIETGSTFCITLVENLDNGLTLSIPSITSGLMHSSVTQLGAEMSATLECNAVGSGQKAYKWFRNNELIAGHTSSVLYMNHAKHGRYQCQALTNNVGPVSKITLIVVREVNECLDRKTHCAGPNLTCEDTLGSYKCGCMYDLKYINGRCHANDSDVDIIRPTNRNRIPLVLLIVVPFLCLTIFIILTLTIYTCIKRRRNQETDIETIAFSVYNENEQTEEIALQNLSSSLNGSSSNDGAIASNVDKIDNADRMSLGTTLSYAPSNVNDSEDEEDVGGFNEYK